MQRKVDLFSLFLARNWLLFSNLFLALFLGLAFASPYLAALRIKGINAVYFGYHLFCNQFPERSFHYFGEQMPLCTRCTAIYASFFLGSLLYALIRNRPFSWKIYLLFILPMAVDGLTQLFGLRTSTNELRVITGTLAGFPSPFFFYPYLSYVFSEVVNYCHEDLTRLTSTQNGSVSDEGVATHPELA